MNQKDVLRKYAEHRILLLRGELTGSLQEWLSTAVEVLDLANHDPIELRIDSTGGSGLAMTALINSIKSVSALVNGVVVGSAASAAFYVLQACDNRGAYPLATFMFHGESVKLRMDPTARQQFDQAHQRSERMLRLTAKRSGQKMKDLRRWSAEERSWTAEEALEKSFIDEIIEYPNKEKADE